MHWLRDEARWMREYARRWESLSFEELKRIAADAESAHDYARAFRARRELARRWAWIFEREGGGE